MNHQERLDWLATLSTQLTISAIQRCWLVLAGGAPVSSSPMLVTRSLASSIGPTEAPWSSVTETRQCDDVRLVGESTWSTKAVV